MRQLLFVVGVLIFASGPRAQFKRTLGHACHSGQRVAIARNVGLPTAHEFPLPDNSWFYMEAQAPRDIMVTGVGMELATCDASIQRVSGAVVSAGGTGAPLRVLARSKPFTVYPQPSWCRAYFDPVLIRAGTPFFVAIENPGFSVAHATSGGTPVRWFSQSTSEGEVVPESVPTTWVFEVYEDGVGPAMRPTPSVPVAIGQNWTITADRVPTGVGFLNIGVSAALSGPLPLPFDLRPFGARDCDLLVSLDGILLPTAASGGSLSITLPVPAAPELVDGHLFAQWLVAPDATRFITTDALEVVVQNLARPTPIAWAHDGGHKVTRAELRASFDQAAVRSRTWDGTTIKTFAARNEVTAFNVVIEAPQTTLRNVRVSLPRLDGPQGQAITSRATSGNGLFDYRGRGIELFVVRYLQIRGITRNVYEIYDERHVPLGLRRPHDADGLGVGFWEDRPRNDRFYPDIAVPHELVPSFDVAAGANQSVWVDVYVPGTAVAGIYRGSLRIDTDTGSRSLPVELTVRNFTLPEQAAAKTMLYYSAENVNVRHVGTDDPQTPAEIALSRRVIDNYFKVARRHRIDLIDENGGPTDPGDRPQPHWQAKLNGQFFVAANGYEGPGTGVGYDFFPIGVYGTWEDAWGNPTQAQFQQHLNAWQTWFTQNAPGTELFLYLEDEPDLEDPPSVARIRQLLTWMTQNTGPGRTVKSFLTAPMPAARSLLPQLDIAASSMDVGLTSQWAPALAYYQQAPRRAYFYNGVRPGTATFVIDDEGVALRMLAWAQWKIGAHRWFYWESTFWRNYEGDGSDTNVFQRAQTFGESQTSRDPLASYGDTSDSYSNGDGVLFYPGTDTVFPFESYGVEGPLASLRLKLWRRGLQDYDYLALAAARNPTAVQQLVQQTVPKVLWEYGVSDPEEPTWVRTAMSWSLDPDVWEAARARLADIIEGR